MRHLALALLVLPALASAEVTAQGEDHFTSSHRAIVAAPPADVYAALGRVDAWWEGAHTYSGDAANLSLALEPGGCFCEALPDGGVAHMRVVMARPGTQLRLIGGLGPLQADPVAGVLDFALRPAEGGTEIVVTYKVAGRFSYPTAQLAPAVDGVLGAQLAGLVRHLMR